MCSVAYQRIISFCIWSIRATVNSTVVQHCCKHKRGLLTNLPLLYRPIKNNSIVLFDDSLMVTVFAHDTKVCHHTERIYTHTPSVSLVLVHPNTEHLPIMKKNNRKLSRNVVSRLCFWTCRLLLVTATTWQSRCIECGVWPSQKTAFYTIKKIHIKSNNIRWIIINQNIQC